MLRGEWEKDKGNKCSPPSSEAVEAVFSVIALTQRGFSFVLSDHPVLLNVLWQYFPLISLWWFQVVVALVSDNFERDKKSNDLFLYTMDELNKPYIIVVIRPNMQWTSTDLGMRIGKHEVHTHERAAMHTRMHTHTHARIHTHTHACTHIHACMHIHTYMHTHTHTHTLTHSLTHSHTHAHTHARMHTHMHTYTHTRTRS